MSYISAITNGDNVIIWERREGEPREKLQRSAPLYFYVDDDDGKYTTIYGTKVKKLEFKTQSQYRNAKNKCTDTGTRMWESDIPPELRVLANEYHNVPAPQLHVSFYDIEVNYDPTIGFAGINNPYAEINSVSILHYWKNEIVVLSIPPEDGWNEERLVAEINKIEPLPEKYNLRVVVCPDEKELLAHFIEEINDSDIICGWNSDMFDTPYVGKRLIQHFGERGVGYLDFQGAVPRWREVKAKLTQKVIGTTLDLQGRVNLDYMTLVKKYEPGERPSYRLAAVADEVLKDGDGNPTLPKLEYSGSLSDLYRNDFAFFVRYNIRDTEILGGFEDKLGYVELANQMVHLSCGQFSHVLGTLKLAEYAIVNHCHHNLKQVVPNFTPISKELDRQIEGALVLEPDVGMHEWIGSIDINSLYPSSILSINISPETLRGQFEETTVAAQAIEEQSFIDITLQLENGDTITKPADEFRQWLLDKKWAVSGYGTVFDQNEHGIIPTILSEWYAKRKEYQALKKEASANNDEEKADFYDRLQYTYKIKLNSLYGALTNLYFRFYDIRMGESTTGTGRRILRHQCSTVNEILTGVYSMDGDALIYGDSVDGKTQIYTDRGVFNIEDLFTIANRKKSNGKEYCDVHDTKTLTYNPETKQNEFQRLKYVMRHKVNKRMYRVWFGNSRYVDVTEDHSLIGYANTRHKTPGLVEVRPVDIGKNNINGILLNRQIPRRGIVLHSDIPKEMFELMGLIIGDGHVEKHVNSGIGLSLGNKDKEEIISNTINPLIEKQWLTSVVHMKNGHDIRLCGAKSWHFLREHLYEEGEKIIPEWLFDCTEEHIGAFLRGYFTADGFASNKTVGLCSTNKQFIVQVNHLLKLCGIPSNYWTETTENSYRGKFSGTYTVRLVVYDGVMFGQKVGFLLKRKNDNVRTKYTKVTQHLTTQSGFCVVHPTKIEQIDTPEYVYDIEVEQTHTFYANDILVHNTDSSYFATFAENHDEAILIADAVADKVNKSYPDFMRNTFLCNDGFDKYIRAGREIVSDRGIFVEKKRYILHIVDKEGKSVDELKVMGLDTKKTILPRVIADKLNSFVERLLKGEDWKDVSKSVVEYRDKLINADDITTLGLPKGIGDIEYFYDKSEFRTFAKISEKTGRAHVSGHVAAALHYNRALKEYGDTVSMPIKDGMKIKVFYLIGSFEPYVLFNDQQIFFKSIALPTDIEVVPQWFLDDFKVDIDAHIERLVDNPLKNILKAINEVPPTRQTLLVNDLLTF